MKLFQSAGFGRHYLAAFNLRNPVSEYASFNERKQALLQDRYDASHILKPVYDKDPNCFFTVCDDPILQMLWARENGLSVNNSLTDILLAQIEAFQPEVLYQLDPILFPSSFVRRLSGCVKKAVAWRAAPIGVADLSAYDVVLSNFETLNTHWREKGLHTAWFSPSWDPEMAPHAANENRPVDVFFTGSYARTTGHDNRLAMLDAVAQLSGYRIDLRLMSRKWGRLADKPLIRWIPVPIRLPKSLRATMGKPVYGREMYATLASAKIVLNPATDIAGDIRGNMRCWEALGCGACMLGSAGQYPEGFQFGVNFEMFTDVDDLKRKIKLLLADEPRRAAIAKAGADMLSRTWSKERQWGDFVSLLTAL